MRDLPDDDDWIAERRRAIGERFRAERLRQNLTQDAVEYHSEPRPRASQESELR